MRAKVNRKGFCPYCGGSDYDPLQTTQQMPPTHAAMKCRTCDNWSARVPRNGAQYPLQDPKSKDSRPTVNLMD